MIPQAHSITFCMLYLLPTVVQSCSDLEYPSNPGCIPTDSSAPSPSGGTTSAGGGPTDPHQTPSPNCNMNDMEAPCNSATGCSWSPGGVTGPWHERNGISNTCAVMTQHNYCTSDYFNTFGGVQVTSSDACCGCGGGSAESTHAGGDDAAPSPSATCVDLQYTNHQGTMGPWNERNSETNTCEIMVQHNYCTDDYFNTYEIDGTNVDVTSSVACCGCGGGSAESTCVDLQYTNHQGTMGPWNERNGETNTCEIMVQHNYCTDDYFNTYEIDGTNVDVTSSDACCGCGGGSAPSHSSGTTSAGGGGYGANGMSSGGGNSAPSPSTSDTTSAGGDDFAPSPSSGTTSAGGGGYGANEMSSGGGNSQSCSECLINNSGNEWCEQVTGLSWCFSNQNAACDHGTPAKVIDISKCPGATAAPSPSTGSTNTEVNTNTQSEGKHQSCVDVGSAVDQIALCSGANMDVNREKMMSTVACAQATCSAIDCCKAKSIGATTKDTAGWPSPTCASGSDPCGTASGDKELFTGAACETCTGVQDKCTDDTIKAYYKDGCFGACAKKFTEAGLNATFKSLGCTDTQKAAFSTVLKEHGVGVDFSSGTPVFDDTNTKSSQTTQLSPKDGNSTITDNELEEDNADMLSDELNAGKRVELAAIVLLIVVLTGVAAVAY